MRKFGRIQQWDDERGFGFIAGDDGQRNFVHISSIKRSAVRPRLGDQVTYLQGTSNDGRPAAVSVVLLGARPRPVPARQPSARTSRSVAGGVLRIGGAALILLVAFAAIQFGRAPMWLLIAYLALGVISIAVYWADKDAAEAGHWRVKETRLHGIDLIGGIAGGLVAQQLLRHKTRKGSFAIATLLIALLHIVALSLLALGYWTVPSSLG